MADRRNGQRARSESLDMHRRNVVTRLLSTDNRATRTTSNTGIVNGRARDRCHHRSSMWKRVRARVLTKPGVRRDPTSQQITRDSRIINADCDLSPAVFADTHISVQVIE
jgi:hypothetical protein